MCYRHSFQYDLFSGNTSMCRGRIIILLKQRNNSVIRKALGYHKGNQKL